MVPFADEIADVIKVRVPTLGAYVVQKAATFTQRPTSEIDSASKAGKDIVYLRDVMAGGPKVRRQIALTWLQLLMVAARNSPWFAEHRVPFITRSADGHGHSSQPPSANWLSAMSFTIRRLPPPTSLATLRFSKVYLPKPPEVGRVATDKVTPPMAESQTRGTIRNSPLHVDP
jgi:hypothetical protein